MSYALVETNTVFVIPSALAVCPYCQHPLTATVEACEQEADGWVASEIEVHCQAEPNMEEDLKGWRWWMHQHTQMPYVYLLPVEEQVRRWLHEHYRFAIDEAP